MRAVLHVVVAAGCLLVIAWGISGMVRVGGEISAKLSEPACPGAVAVRNLDTGQTVCVEIRPR